MFKNVMKLGNAEMTYQAKKSLSETPKLINLFWETTLRCNAKCKHCGSNAGENIHIEDELKTEEIKKVFSDVAAKYDASRILVSVTGGEPLVREDVFEVMKYAKSLGFYWGMTTNGILINDDIIAKMKDSGMTTISISLDGLEKTHDDFRCVNGAFKKIIENILKLKNANFLNYLQVTTVVNKTNIMQLDDLYDILSNLGISSWRIVNMDPIGRAMQNDDLSLDGADFSKLMQFIKNKRKLKNKMDVTFGCSHYLGMDYEKEVRKNMFFCVTGFTTASVLYNGDIFVCPSVPRRKELVQGNIRLDNFVDIWENKFKWVRNLDKLKCDYCSNCEDWKYCRGDSLDTWDFDNNKPKLCLPKLLKRGRKK